MSSYSRKQRHSRRRQNLGDSLVPPTNTSSAFKSPPHPYHESPPPPPPIRQSLMHQTSTNEYKVSAISKDALGTGSALESVLEYSDTSDDMREDSYFLLQENPDVASRLLGSHHHLAPRSRNPLQRNRQDVSGESSFRDLKLAGSKSSNVVQFSSQTRSDSSSDSEDGGLGDNFSRDKQLDNRVITNSTQDSDRTKRSDAKDKNKLTWMKRVAFGFRSPSGIFDQDNKHSRQSRTNRHPEHPISKLLVDVSDRVARHRVSSGSTMEYTHALLSHPTKPNSQITEFGVPSYETSPLLSGNKLHSSYSHGVEKSGVSSDIHPFQPSILTIEGKGSNRERLNCSPRSLLSTIPPFTFSSRRTAAQVAAYFLMDYEASRSPTLSTNFEKVTKEQLTLYRFHFSSLWRNFVNLATVLLFLSHTQNVLVGAM
jgi:hypothetical protein